MLDQRLAGARDRLHRTGRLLESLDPDAPLKRGYARVSARLNDAVVGSAAVARAAGAVTLHFADGTVDARGERSGAKSYAGTKQIGKAACRERVLKYGVSRVVAGPLKK